MENGRWDKRKLGLCFYLRKRGFVDFRFNKYEYKVYFIKLYYGFLGMCVVNILMLLRRIWLN